MLIRLQLPARAKMLECVVRDRTLRAGDEIDLVHQNGNLSFRGRFRISRTDPLEGWYMGEVSPNQTFAELVCSVKEVAVDFPRPITPRSL